MSSCRWSTTTCVGRPDAMCALNWWGHMFQTKALVHEAFLRLVGHSSVEWKGHAHFFGVAAKAMRSVLFDHAHARGAAKRGGSARAITLDEAGGIAGPQASVDVLALDQALGRLAELDSRKSRLVELRYFGGLGNRGGGSSAGGLTGDGQAR
jgi:RNA polymerase sigma-70 factor (ECF subfamily)